MQTCGMTCVKIMLFVFNFLFLLIGIGVIVLGGVTLNRELVRETDDVPLGVPIFIMCVGAVILIISFFGCCGAIQESACMLMTFAVMVGIVFVCLLAAGIAALVKKDALPETVSLHLKETMAAYKQNDTADPFTRYWDFIQTRLDCCGFDNPEDWKQTPGLADELPKSCCSGNATDSCTYTDDNHYTQGCKNEYVEALEGLLLILGCGVLGLSVILLIGMSFACCMRKQIVNYQKAIA